MTLAYFCLLFLYSHSIFSVSPSTTNIYTDCTSVESVPSTITVGSDVCMCAGLILESTQFSLTMLRPLNGNYQYTAIYKTTTYAWNSVATLSNANSTTSFTLSNYNTGTTVSFCFHVTPYAYTTTGEYSLRFE